MSVYEASIDDNDAAVLYSNGWVLVSEDGSWTGTMHSTSVVGSTMRVRFRGSAVAVICTIPTGSSSQHSMASISIDGGPPVTVSRQTTGPVQWNYQLFTADSLPFGSHLLVMTNTGGETYLRFDRIDYDPTDSHAPKAPAPPPAAAPTTTTSVVVLTSASTQLTQDTASSDRSSSANVPSSSQSVPLDPTAPAQGHSNSTTTGIDPTPSTPASRSTPAINPPGFTSKSDNTTIEAASTSGTPTAAIIGGILGGILFLVIAAILLFSILRCRRKRSHLHESSDHIDSPRHRPAYMSTIPTPFFLAPQTSEHFQSIIGSSSVVDSRPSAPPSISESTTSQTALITESSSASFTRLAYCADTHCQLYSQANEKAGWNDDPSTDAAVREAPPAYYERRSGLQ